MANVIKKFLEQWTKTDLSAEHAPRQSSPILYDEQQEQLNHDMSILGEHDIVSEERVQKQAEKEVRIAAEDSLKELHVIQRGRCPKCGARLHLHTYASICENCGWHTFETPKNGPVKVHLAEGANYVEGEKCSVIKGSALVIKDGVVFARIPAGSVSWIEYCWTPEEVKERHKQMIHRLEIRCGWCGGEVNPDTDGFHLTHIAFGATQERYCFCSDECYEAFRKLYPSRVHRNCYDRSCADCDLCDKRYKEGGDGILTFMKDYLWSPAGKKEKNE